MPTQLEILQELKKRELSPDKSAIVDELLRRESLEAQQPPTEGISIPPDAHPQLEVSDQPLISEEAIPPEAPQQLGPETPELRAFEPSPVDRAMNALFPADRMPPAKIARAQIRREAHAAGLPIEEHIEQAGERPIPLYKAERFLDSVGHGAVGTIGSMLGAAEWIVDSDIAKDLSVRSKEWVVQKAPENPSIAEKIGSGLGSSAIFFVPGLGVVRGASAMARVSPKLAQWMGVGMATALESMTEAGATYQEVLRKTGDEQQASNSATFTLLANIPLIAVTNKLGVFADKGGAIKRSLAGSLMEGGQEFGQEIIGAEAADRPIQGDDLLDAFIVGAAAGGGMGAVAGANLTATKNKWEKTARTYYNEKLRTKTDEPGAAKKWAKDFINKNVDRITRAGVSPLDTPIESVVMQQQYEDARSAWLGETAVQELRATVTAANQQRAIQETTGEKKYDTVSQDVDKAIQIYIDLQRHPEHLNEYYDLLTPEQKRIVDLSQNLTENQKLIADEISKHYSEAGGLAVDAEVIHNLLDNFASRVWDVKPPKRGSEQYRKFGTTTRHAKARKFGTILEGWATNPVTGEQKANASDPGFKLKVEGATNNLSTYREEIHNAIQNKKFIDVLGEIKNLDGVPLLSTKEVEGSTRIVHPGFTKWGFGGSVNAEPIIETLRSIKESSDVTVEGEGGGKSAPVVKLESIVTEAMMLRGFKEGEAQAAIARIKAAKGGAQTKTVIKNIEKQIHQKVKGVTFGKVGAKNIVITPEGAILERKDLYAPQEVAKNLNNMLGVSKIKGGKFIDAATRYNAILKAWILQTSFFHHLAFMRSFYLGSSPFGEAVGKIKAGEGFMESLKGLTPRQAYKSGQQAIMELAPEIELLVRNGLTLGRIQEWEEKVLREEDTFVGRMMDKHGATKATKDAINRFREKQADFLFKQFGAGLKAKAALIELRSEIKKNPNEDPNRVAERVANLMNDDFGGLNLKRMGRNPTTQHFFRLFALAPDWTESNIRSAVKAFNTGEEGAMYRRFWARILTKSVFATVAANAMLHGDETPEMYAKAWEAGKLRWMDIDVTPIYKLTGGETDKRKYFSIIGHFKDPLKFALDPIKSAHYKGSPTYKHIFELITGKDWADREFTELEELLRTGQTVRPFATFAPRAGEYSRLPSYLASQAKGSQPIQAQQLINWMLGETEAFDAIGLSLGLGIRTTYEKSPRQKKEEQRARKTIRKIHKR